MSTESGSLSAAEPTKPCVACKEPIRVDATVCRYCGTSQNTEPKLSTKKLLVWVASASAVIGLIAGVYNLYGPARDQFADSAETKAAIRQAQAQYDEADYPGALKAYSEILQKHPRNKTAGEGRLQAAMGRVRNYSVTAPEDDKGVALRADAELSEIIRLLEPAAAGATGTRGSDVTAHLGWAHFLKFRIAQNDSFENTEPYLRKAHELDGLDVYANAMLGNWLLQTHRGRVHEGSAYLRTAVEHSAKEKKSWARRFQLGALIHNDNPGAHRELAMVANEMRKSGERLNSAMKRDILLIYAPAVTRLAELDEVLSVGPPEEMWATYSWLADDGESADAEWKKVKSQFNLARMQELAGRPQEARLQYEQIERYPRIAQTALATPTKEALSRLNKTRPR